LDEGDVKVGGMSMQFGRTTPVSYVAQTKSLHASLKVFETIRYAHALSLGKFDDSLAIEWVNEQGIPLNQRMGTLSGGQRTQVALATAVGRNAPVIVLDEPMADLDPIARDLVSKRLVALARAGRTILVSSHAVTELSAFCDHVVVMKDGSAILSARVEDISRNQPLDRVVVDLLRDPVGPTQNIESS
jgi:ABC-2 type transport system ATP-binding protein